MDILINKDEKVLLELRPQKKAQYYYAIINSWHFFCIFLLVLCLYIVIMKQPYFSGFIGNIVDSIFLRFNESYVLSALVISFLLFCINFIYDMKFMLSHKYLITNIRCMRQYGIFNKAAMELPYNVIADVNIRSDVVETIFSLGSVYVDTMATIAASSKIGYKSSSYDKRLRFQGLSLDNCQRILDIVSSQIGK